MTIGRGGEKEAWQSTERCKPATGFRTLPWRTMFSEPHNTDFLETLFPETVSTGHHDHRAHSLATAESPTRSAECQEGERTIVCLAVINDFRLHMCEITPRTPKPLGRAVRPTASRGAKNQRGLPWTYTKCDKNGKMSYNRAHAMRNDVSRHIPTVRVQSDFRASFYSVSLECSFI